jgi:hypothetical protein
LSQGALTFLLRFDQVLEHATTSEGGLIVPGRYSRNQTSSLPEDVISITTTLTVRQLQMPAQAYIRTRYLPVT